MNGTERVLKFRKDLKSIFSSPQGLAVLDFLEESYVEIPVLSDTTEVTHYRLGQKELIQGLIKDVKTDLEDLENLTKGG